MRRGVWQYFIVVALLAYVYYPTFLWMVDRWSARDSYYGHGFLIPMVALYWIFKKRSSCMSCERTSNGIGYWVLAAGALIQLASSVLRIYFLSAISFVIVLFAIGYLLFGKALVKQVWFPIAFLLVMIPLPLLVISQVTLEMKFFVSEISTGLLNFIGIHAVREGSYIYTPNAMVLVGDPCSGLRSFLAFLCLGLIFAYGSRLGAWQKFAMVLLGLPLAVISNVIRVFAMGFLAEVYGMDLISTKVVHDGGGILVFVVALICFLAIRKKLETGGVSVG